MYKNNTSSKHRIPKSCDLEVFFLLFRVSIIFNFKVFEQLQANVIHQTSYIVNILNYNIKTKLIIPNTCK